MCGICGVWNYADKAPVDRHLLRRMTDAMRHRGPDDGAFHFDDAAGLGLGFRRLSILDLTPAGRQPMPNEDGSVWVVANGEIYNFQALRTALVAQGHRFRSTSDTEVIVHAYEERGEGCLADLNGMFGLAIWDSRRRRLVLARDRVGEKPLYVHDDGRRLLFASELKAIIEDASVPVDLDWTAVGEYFAAGYVTGDRSILRAVRKLPPAHRLIAEDGATRSARYWDWLPAFGMPATERSEDDYAAELREALRESVRLRMISDVPLGAFLSGGLDSSSIVAAMASLSSAPIKTFSIGFAQPAFNELPHARQVAQRFGTDHHELVVDLDTVLDLLPRLIQQYDEPFADSSSIPTYCVSMLARRHVTVCLSGDGGDETCAGYGHHRRGRYEALVDWLPPPLRQALLRPLAALPIGLGVQRLARRLMEDPPGRYAAVMTSMPAEHVHELLSGDASERIGRDGIGAFLEAFHRAADLDPLSRMQCCDLAVYLPDDMLVKVDRASMLNSLEVRCPFLDPRVMEVAAHVPPHLRLSTWRGKRLLRRAMRHLLPDGIVNRPKAGFAVPLHDWFSGGLGAMAADVLLDRRTSQRGIFSQRAVARLLDARPRFARLSSQVWALLVFELWCRSYVDGPRTPPAAAAAAD